MFTVVSRRWTSPTRFGILIWKGATLMSSEAATELYHFHEFLGQQLQGEGTPITVEESVQAFRAYQRDLERFQRDCEPALAESALGQSQPLDVHEIIARGRQRAVAQGIDVTCPE